MVVPTYHSMIETMRETDMILPLPDIVIDRLPLSQIQLEAFDFPFELPPVTSFQAWHPAWIRTAFTAGCVIRSFRSSDANLSGFVEKAGPP